MRRHSAHVDADVLAELSAGMVSGRRAARIHAHLAGCQRCARVGTGLSEVGVLLAFVPSATMPAAVTRRLSAAIAEEAAARSGMAGSPVRLAAQEPFPRAEQTGGGRPRNWLTSPVAVRGFAAAAAVCLVAAGGYTIVQLTSPGRSGFTPPGASGGINNGLRGGGSGPYRVSPSALSSIHPPRVAFGVVTTGTDYQSATLGTQVENELGRSGQIGANRLPGGLLQHQPTAQQEACVQGVVPGVAPTFVDAARYQGHPATIIALAPGAGQLGQAWVVGPACSGDKNDILAHVRLPPAGG
jgi:hypothetical protein